MMVSKLKFAGLLMVLVFLQQACFSLTDSIGVVKKNGNLWIVHKVDKSQGLYAISKKYNVLIDDIKKSNTENLDKLKLNQIIYIPWIKKSPTAGEFIHEVKKGETLYRISKQYNVKVEDIEKWNNTLAKNIKKGHRLRILQQIPPVNNKKLVIEQNQLKQSVLSSDTTGNLEEVNEEGVGSWLNDSLVGNAKSMALHKDAPVGTIIKVTSIVNNTTVYVKVVGNLPKSNQKLKPIIQLSKYSAKQLGVNDPSFLVKLTYYKVKLPGEDSKNNE
jgi:LysM repeat protein